MGLTPEKESNFLQVSNGRIRSAVTKETPGAKRRDWETKDGKSGTKWELVYTRISGHIVGIDFQSGEYGEQLLIRLLTKGKTYSLAMPSDSKYAINFLQRVPGADLLKEVELTPYS